MYLAAAKIKIGIVISFLGLPRSVEHFKWQFILLRLFYDYSIYYHHEILSSLFIAVSSFEKYVLGFYYEVFKEGVVC
jgi:hypothetical protein